MPTEIPTKNTNPSTILTPLMFTSSKNGKYSKWECGKLNKAFLDGFITKKNIPYVVMEFFSFSNPEEYLKVYSLYGANWHWTCEIGFAHSPPLKNSDFIPKPLLSQEAEKQFEKKLSSQSSQSSLHPLGQCLDEAKALILGSRQDTYGSPEDFFSIVAEYWSTYITNCNKIIDFKTGKLILSPLDVANMMILFKQARKLGQAHTRDNYIDSCGYESIAADRLSDTTNKNRNKK